MCTEFLTFWYISGLCRGFFLIFNFSSLLQFRHFRRGRDWHPINDFGACSFLDSEWNGVIDFFAAYTIFNRHSSRQIFGKVFSKINLEFTRYATFNKNQHINQGHKDQLESFTTCIILYKYLHKIYNLNYICRLLKYWYISKINIIKWSFYVHLISNHLAS